MADFKPDAVAPATQARVLRVAVPTPLRRLFDYRPAGAPPAGGWRAGIRFKVPFGRRELVGIVIACADESDLSPAQLKPIVACLDAEPLPADWLWLCEFTARYYQHALGDTLHNALPGPLRQGRPLEARTRERWRLETAEATALEQLGRAPRQRELVTLLAQHRHGLVTSAVSAQGFTRAQLQGLARRGLVSCHGAADRIGGAIRAAAGDSGTDPQPRAGGGAGGTARGARSLPPLSAPRRHR